MALNTLPPWVQWFAALAPASAAVVTAIVAIIVAVVSYRQWRVAREKLILDLFEKRVEVYNLAMTAVNDFVGSTNFVASHIRSDAAKARASALFVFGDDVVGLLTELEELVDAFKNGTPEQVMGRDPGNVALQDRADKIADRLPLACQPYMRMTHRLHQGAARRLRSMR